MATLGRNRLIRTTFMHAPKPSYILLYFYLLFHCNFSFPSVSYITAVSPRPPPPPPSPPTGEWGCVFMFDVAALPQSGERAEHQTRAYTTQQQVAELAGMHTIRQGTGSIILEHFSLRNRFFLSFVSMAD